MAKTKKKLKQTDINRNTSIEVSHTIRKIKENERKYTVILVIFFMIILSVVGYHFLTVDNSVIYSDIKTASNNNSYISLSSSNITLTSDDVLSDSLGLKSNKYKIHISNNTNKIKQYKIYLVSSDCKCGNSSFDKNSIHYSVDGKNVDLLTDDLFVEGILKKKEEKDIIYRIWIDDNVVNKDLHYHGYFILK